jgi:large subunit ribosomal protein L6
MSRIGKKPIQIPEGIKVEIKGQALKVLGSKGELQLEIHRDIKAEIKDNEILISPQKENPSKKAKGLWGLYRALVFNMIEGINKGFERKLEIEGVGYKAIVEEDSLVLNVGFANPVRIKKPEGINFLVEKNVITVSGASKQEVGQTAAIIRKAKKAEPYQGEKIRRKEGKKVVSAKK